jgi:predicted component of type VI protein secretion system
MSIKIVVSMSGSNEPMSEHSFDKEAITIGRTLGNEIVLPDVERKVSSKHAKIENKGGTLHILDLGSTNGSFLNGKKIDANHPVLLKNGDRIGIGSFQLLIHATPDHVESTTRHVDPTKAAEKIAEALSQVYAKHVSSDPEVRRAALREAIRDRLRIAGPDNGRTVLTLVRNRFQSGGAAKSDPAQDLELRRQEELYRSGYQVMSHLSSHFLGDSNFESAEQVERFGRLIEQALEVTLEWVANCLKGRREFENQFSADLTMVFSKEGNPLKSASGAQDMARYILDWRSARELAQSKAPLENAFKDLTMHQLGLLAGVQDCMKALLVKLDPKQIEATATAQSGGLFKNKFQKTWELYAQSHKEMFEENSKLFNELIYPNLRKGYLESHKEGEKNPPTAGTAGSTRKENG